ncbi:MAG: NRDE family protein [Saprospiraceae bacterium]|nr:NRDE family protein [Saprospiraceae bacterium]
MCTVTYIPQKEGWMLTNNRDETPLRASYHLIKKETGGSRLLYPPDEKGGSWIAMSTPGRVICLLNGAFIKHAHRPPYRFSRGIIVLAAARAQNKVEFVENLDLEGVEPFTLIWKDDKTFFSLVWDGKESHIQDLNPAQNYIWSSSTLYTDEQKKGETSIFKILYRKKC